MKRVLLALIILPVFGMAQTELQFTQHFDNPYLLNPAASGMMSIIDIDLGYRKQWVGIENSPSTIYMTGHSVLRFKKDNDPALGGMNPDGDFMFKSPEISTGRIKNVVGGKIINDQFGAFAKTSVFGSYSFHVPFTKTINLSFGASIGWSNVRLDRDKVTQFDEGDNTYSAFLANGASQHFFDMNAGVMLYHKKFYFGYSVTQLLSNKIDFGNIESKSNLLMTHYIMGGYNWDINEKLRLSPNVILKMAKGVPMSFELGAKLTVQKTYWAGISYRYSDAVAILAGLNFGKYVNLGYSYDIPVGGIRRQGGSHEIHIGFMIGRNPKVEDRIKE